MMKVHIELNKPEMIHPKTEYSFPEVKNIEIRDEMVIVIDDTDFGHPFEQDNIKRMIVK